MNNRRRHDRRLLAATLPRRPILKALAGAACAGARGTVGHLVAPAPANARPASVAADAFAAKAIYMNPRITTDNAGFLRLVDLIDRTELNALVVDVKELGVYVDTDVALFREAGAVDPLLDAAGLLRTLHARDIYAIARHVVFKDDAVAAARPDLAVADATTGDTWLDYNGGAWLNPFAEEVRDANAQFAAELAGLGFDEIQFDYVRFPSDGDLATMDFGRPVTEAARVEAITGFLALTREQVAPTGANTAADVFGYTLLLDDIGIGQNAARIAEVVDYVCPMVYPSHFPNGSIDVPGHPNDFPAETIAISMASGTAMIGDPGKLRPWLQDFSLAGMSEYGTAEVRVQIDAAEAAGTSGWMIWDPNNEYHVDAFAPAE